MKRDSCPHGDPLCPCQDGDPCHYEGKDAMTCPKILEEREACAKMADDILYPGCDVAIAIRKRR